MASFSDIITFTRSSVAKYWDASGVLQEAAVDEKRLEHDPTTGNALGLLVEAQRTNLLTYSEALDNANWSKTRTTITADANGSPDGATTMDKIVEGTDSDTTFYVQQSDGVTDGVQVAFSCFVAGLGENRFLWLRTTGFTGNGSVIINPDTGTVLSTDGTVDDYSIEDIGGGTYRVSVECTPTETTTGIFRLQLRKDDGTTSGTQTYTGDGTSGIYLWGAQLEEGAFPTNYIKTTGSQVTRSLDNATVTDLSWYNPNAGTFLVEIGEMVTPDNSNNRGIFALDDDAGNLDSSMYIFRSSGGHTFTIRDNSGLIASEFGFGANTDKKLAIAFDGNEMVAVAAGTLSTVSLSSALPDLSSNILRLGDHTAGSINPSHIAISNFEYWPYRLSDDDLKSVTS